MGSSKPAIHNNIKNCLSFDIEGFVESNMQSFHIDRKYISKSDEQYEIEKNMDFILAFLAEAGIKATLFFLGRIAEDIPHIVKKTAQYGHEIACHSHEHRRVFGLSHEEFRKKVGYAKKILEDLSGNEVYGFRAPDFSITKSSLWALDILHEAGFIYDSSIYPISMHDVYGISSAKPFIYKMTNGLIEFPLSVVEIFRRRIPFGGGGYFRLYPITLTKYFILKINKSGHSCMFYIHPYEIGPIIPKIAGLSNYRKFRHYYNCKNGDIRLKNMLSKFKFGTAIEILKEKNLVN